MNSHHEAAVRHLAKQYKGDPVRYGTEFLGQVITPQQQAIATALQTHRKVLVPSANGVGKTFAAGWLANYFHDVHDPGIVLATSSSHRQVVRQLFKEIRRLRPFKLGLMPEAPFVRGTSERHFVEGFSTNKADSFQGSHEQNMFLLFDEATGVRGEFWERGESMFKGIEGHWWLCPYNPNDTTSPAYAQESGGDWAVVRLSALDHPNIEAELRGLPPIVPGAVRFERVEKRIEKQCEYAGRDEPPAEAGAFHWPPLDLLARIGDPPPRSVPYGWMVPIEPSFEVQVLGRWPSKALHAVWSPAEFERCLRKVEIDPTWPVQISCDMARNGGDKIVIGVRKGIALVWLEVWPSSTKSKAVAERLRQLAWDWAPTGTKPQDVPVLVDDTGGYGSGVVDYPEGYNFVGVIASTRSRDPAKYVNTRSELWWNHKIAAEEGGFFLGNLKTKGVGREEAIEALRADYTAVRYAFDKWTRRVIESKDAVRGRLGRSPDYADTVNMGWYLAA